MAKRKRKQRKVLKTKKYVFMIMALFLFSLIVLSYPFIVPKSFFSPSLECDRNEDLIVCTWTNCKYGSDSELTLAKVPDYAETVGIQESSGSSDFAADPIEGTYTAILFCNNGEIIKRITIS